jgi:hypothetical protein
MWGASRQFLPFYPDYLDTRTDESQSVHLDKYFIYSGQHTLCSDDPTDLSTSTAYSQHVTTVCQQDNDTSTLPASQHVDHGPNQVVGSGQAAPARLISHEKPMIEVAGPPDVTTPAEVLEMEYLYRRFSGNGRGCNELAAYANKSSCMVRLPRSLSVTL